ncbi:GNAT family N-acetyltransferase [Maribacter sp. HTCC2170]|uniref:GNAT family N-acetyltransferase n=1 Tax=Maribacter sp. (strain HTCC2170 / KCCM 42371) TaxID=313603 RepID=UPI00006AFD3A|nr:GNAT family N-acetyltransferase [Maribacter sp. HTCC2170]EAR01234.1 hypothetical protein FB2170_10956 [Maribacter sp. HTCC2170]
MIEANREHKDLVVSILVSAFEDIKEDNSINFVVKQDERRSDRMKILMGYLFEKALLFGKAYISDDEKACVLLTFSEKQRVSFKTIGMDLKLAIKCIDLKNLKKVVKRQRLVKKQYPKENHVRPIITGVMKDKFGAGTGARLIMDVIDYYKENQLPVVLDTVSDYNVRLYQKFGFRIEHKEESLGYPIYFMRLN